MAVDDDDDERDAEVAEELEDEDAEGEADAEGEVVEEDAGSDADAEVAEEDEEDDGPGEVVGAVKTRSARSKGKQKAEETEESDAAPEDEGDDSDEDSDKPGEEEDWEAADDVVEEEEVGNATASRCVFCGQDEEHDPGEEFEDYLACAVCGDNAHRHCAREAETLASDEDASDWMCKDCIANGLVPDFRNVPEIIQTNRRSSAPRMARDLLPSARGGIKPDSHSVFNTLILDEDPRDGSRSLRKRKATSEVGDEPPRPAIRKRRRPSADDDEDELAVETPAATGMDLDGADDEAESPRSRSGRPQRHLKRKKGARIISRDDGPQKSIVLSIPITVAQWDQIERDLEKKRRRRERDRLRRARQSRRTVTVEPEELPQQIPAVQTSMYTNPFYAFPDRETDENKGKPYGGILTDAEADTQRTYPADHDREAFSTARTDAERRWKEKLAASEETPARSKASGQPSKIKCINFGQFEIDTWHAAPYPEEYSRNKHLYICEFCLKYMSSDYVAWRHKLKCRDKHPPGDEIYRSKMTNPETGAETTLSFFEVDGRRNPLYCQNLCLLAKLFLGSKTLYYDVEPFLFYIMTENDDFGCHFVGYFSKEKRGCGLPPPMNPHTSFDESQDAQAGSGAEPEPEPEQNALSMALTNPGNNVSCILVLPVHMRRGFGRVLIEFSYLLTKVEGRTGSPEKPLSDMGLVSYRSYWRTVLCRLLLRYKEIGEGRGDQQISVAQIAKETGMTPDDIISTLEALRFLVKDPITRTYALRLDYDYMREYVDKHEKKATVILDESRLVWTPYVMASSLFTLGEEAAAPLQTVAPREEANELPDEPMEGVQQTLKAANAAAFAQSNEDTAHESTEPPDEPTPQTNGVGRRKTPPAALALTPQPSFTDTPRSGSPTRPSPHKTPNGTTRDHSPTSSFSTSQPASAGPIPPTRFEVFPPVPGMGMGFKKRPGRPSRSGRGSRSSYGGTPARRSGARRTVGREASGVTASAVRRTRSKLGESAVSAAEVEEAEGGDEEAVDAEGGAEGIGEEDADAPGEDDEEIRYE